MSFTPHERLMLLTLAQDLEMTPGEVVRGLLRRAYETHQRCERLWSEEREELQK